MEDSSHAHLLYGRGSVQGDLLGRTRLVRRIFLVYGLESPIFRLQFGQQLLREFGKSCWVLFFCDQFAEVHPVLFF